MRSVSSKYLLNHILTQFGSLPLFQSTVRKIANLITRLTGIPHMLFVADFFLILTTASVKLLCMHVLWESSVHCWWDNSSHCWAILCCAAFGTQLCYYHNQYPIIYLTHWRLGDVVTIFELWFSNLLHRIEPWWLMMKLLWSEYHRTSLMRSQHWSR